MSTGKEGSKLAKRAPRAPKAVAAKVKGSAATKTVASKKKGVAKARSTSAAKRGSARRGRIAVSLLKTIDKQLNLQRNEILSLYRLDQGVGRGVSHEGEDDVDRANFDASRDLALSLSTAERESLQLIQEALGRLDRGSYGSCSNCSVTIAEERLLSIPWARHCLDCQELEEGGLLSQ